MTPGSTPPAETPGGAATRIIRGVVRLGRGKAEGIESFGNTPEALLSAIAPSAALFLVLALSQFVQGYDATEVTKVLILITALLLRLVVSQALASVWGKAEGWLRYATALLWSAWLPMVLSLVVLSIAQIIMPGIVTSRPALAVIMIGIEAYEFWLSWFVAKSGLGLKGGKAALLVVAVNLAVASLYLIAIALPPHYNALKELMGPLPKPHP